MEDEAKRTDIVSRITAAVVSEVRRLGLDVDEPVVLRDGANLVVHLHPEPVVARIATLTAEMRGNPADYLRRERDICAALETAGLNVVAPTDLVDPGPHQADGHDFALLRYRELTPVDLESPEHAVTAGETFADLTHALAALPDELGRGDEGQPWRETASLLHRAGLAISESSRDKIEAVVDRLRSTEPDDRWQLVHGDAHKGNVALGNGEAIWFDFEDANLRPAAWDLASLRRAWPAAGDVACNRLGVDPQSPSMRWHHEFREVYALLWNILYSQRFADTQAATAERLRECWPRTDWRRTPKGV